MPPTSPSALDSADWPCRNTATYIVIAPSVIAVSIVASATQPYIA